MPDTVRTAVSERSCVFECEITHEEVAQFAQLTGDANPLHVDAEYARTTEFGRPIAHGALLVGLVSRVLGMHIPGERSLILSMRIQFPKPLFYPATVRVEGTLASFDERRKTGVVRVVITDVSRLWNVAESDVSFALHEAARVEPPPAPAVARAPQAGRAQLLITGATGGVGRAILPLLSAQYAVNCLGRRAPIEQDIVDLEAPGAFEAYLDQRSPAEVYGIVHLSAAPVPRAFVSDDLAAVRRQLRHSVEVPLLLARWARQPGSGVKRMILCGSTFGMKFPKPQLGAYALGKAAMEYLPRLLTADLSAQGATVNVIAPTVMPVGLNEGMSERARATLIGKMPTHRLVEPRDAAQMILFLLSENAAQVNGAIIPIDGGMAE